ncbi:MAG: glycosyltransferase family 4 protein [Actinobacteria bacterium]|nr:glycosyltransferase family 4 protein [Actinomycetota bacterium]MBU4385908.1 glycosyltransferase family 4 protein [Actinomycetota bacterium]MBU4489658.1 glycosyltransferase family 4 protein [Actinomycetota bacterium]MCG2795073.1 glycosyltransferase family 4 protein [Actinomycetes bacterium]
MRALILSWEYPPRIIGGLGRHVYHLATSLATGGAKVHVVTKDHPGAPDYEESEGVHIHRVVNYPPDIPQEDWVPWTLQFNVALLEKAVSVVNDLDNVDVIHAHDWLVAHAAASLKHAYRIPMVATIHATEYGRHQGHLPGPMNKLIHQIEWWLTFESVRTVCCSQYMMEQITNIFQLPGGKVKVIPNGIDAESFQKDVSVDLFKKKYVDPGDKLVFFVGRLVYEKGVQTVIEAMPRILDKIPNVTFVVSGSGPHMNQLKSLVGDFGLEKKVKFTGYVDSDDLSAFYRCADLTVVPSLYEPFGMVVLESMAMNTPTIVADTGGLSEIVVHEETGLKFDPGNPDSLADAMLRILSDEELAARLTHDARVYMGERYSWDRIARQTIEVYRDAERAYEYSPRTLKLCPPLPGEATG